MPRPRPIVLTILDGWGYRAETRGNAIALARKPNYDALLQKFPNTLVRASDHWVGLPDGQMGNSEVGHMNMGAGRIIQMEITRLDLMIQSGEFFKNTVLLDAMARGRERQLHVIGLLSDGGVHSHIEQLFALLRIAREQKVARVFIHCFMDGRDTPPHSGVDFLAQLQQKMREYGTGRIASVTGRYYGMDRDNRWERIERAYRAMVHGEAPVKSADPIAAVRLSYERGVTDEFVEPIVITESAAGGAQSNAAPVGLIRDDDAVIFYNFRADRARQISRALAEPGFDKFADAKRPKNLLFTGMTQYDKTFSWMRYLLGQQKIEQILAQVFAELNYKNLRVAETEKYAHVTYFFNGGVEKPFPGEERILVPSQKVPTYDLKPEMSAAGVADAVTSAIRKGDFDAIIMNFANADMVGHSGNLEAAIKAVETVDECLGSIRQAMHDAGDTAWIITADHGNAETMVDPVTGGPHTYHTTNPVPFVLVSNDSRVSLNAGGALRDIAPTMLGVLGVQEPIEMTGRDLRIIRS
ncbi:MAG TPA: 2,3-bisphosphoglycerate-independent phosphoglycerate mutase [Candidatus Acidoferrales bacterium]|jgi:2,3-bisphosphoglycerate-independent phosphoglycerate mutase|nr:2,3-bisphosphoglycerate-independent phosphoglycerate mutase [Candidatus Acidoferrales bacterium]